MRRFDKYSIKWRLFGYLVLFIAIPVALLWFFQIVFLEQFYTTIKMDDVEQSVETIVSGFSDEDNNGSDLQTLISRMARQNDVSIRVYESDGNEIFGSDYGPDSGVPLDEDSVQNYYERAENMDGQVFEYFDKPAMQTLDASQNGRLQLHKPRAGKSIVYARLVPAPESEPLLLVTSAVITPVDATVRTLRVQLIYITLILLALSLFLAVLMSARISRPIIETTASAKQLANGDYDTVFDAHGYREIAELNKTLNFAASEMSKVERLRKELIANVSHDLRTPLTMIVGYAEVMRDIPGENSPENVQVIIDEASRLSRLVSDMLDMSQLQLDEQTIERVPTHITQTIHELLTRYEAFTSKHGYHISFEEDQEVLVSCDHDRLAQAIYNLVNNAINYAGPDKKVVVRQIVKGDVVRIEVEDTGVGIPKKDIPYIWDRYYKVEGGEKRTTVGTGLGLSIVRTVLELHDADFGVESEEGKGSTFWFELPILKDEQAEN